MSITYVVPASFSTVGSGLSRPECVVATATGDVVASDWRGGVSIVRSDGGRVETRLALNSPISLRPNGISFTAARSLLIAQLGDCGGVWTLAPDGTLSPFLTEIEGAPLPPTNFAIEDECHRTWISVSTRQYPRQLAWRPDVADGFVACVTQAGARLVADGLHYANEVRLDPSGRFLYVVETFGRRLIRYPVDADGTLGARETVVHFEYGFFPDGFAFDVQGGIWVTSLVSNRVVRVRADREIETVETAFAAGIMAREHLGRIPGTTLQHVTSLSFGDHDRRTVFL
ncbi:MAG: SMP-30/gluconolactonase/LRE family protein, partial [Acidobacteria bacterium]|nr:SMP-30/gluconolactonase/LRE family protein [Acidobacteriota bacterium]